MQFKFTDVSVNFVDQVGEDGIVARVSCVVEGALYLNNIGVRRRRDGMYALSFPAKKNRCNGLFFYFKPVSPEVYSEFERAVFKTLRLAKEPSLN